MKLVRALRAAVAGFGLAACAVPARAQQVTGAGSTFVYPVMAAWSDGYSRQTGVRINYQSIGSGGGIAQIKARTITFGATDRPLDSQALGAAGLAQFPCVIGGIVPVVNLKGIQSGELHLTGKLLADIFLGGVRKWNDPAIAAANPGLVLPSRGISVVHRSDGSGTTFNFTHFLSQVNTVWKSRVGEGTSVAWPTGVGGKGNEGVAAYVERIKGSIGYLEYAFVQQNRMTYTLVRNAAGEYVMPGTASFQAAAASADWAHAQDFNLVMTNSPGRDAYPITATTFILMPRQPDDAAKSKAALDFFRWAFEHGQKLALTLDYVPLPDPLVRQIESYWSARMH